MTNPDTSREAVDALQKCTAFNGRGSDFMICHECNDTYRAATTALAALMADTPKEGKDDEV